jgi:hypothetical protein
MQRMKRSWTYRSSTGAHFGITYGYCECYAAQYTAAKANILLLLTQMPTVDHGA